MIKIVQFGEGNFLRSFADVYFNELNEKFNLDYSVDIVVPINSCKTERYADIKDGYFVVFCGVKDGVCKREFKKITCINRVISPFENKKAFFDLSRDENLKIIVSNTTEAGIVFNEDDRAENFPFVSFPAKLTLFLYERFKSGGGNLFLLPVELIDDNANALLNAVRKYVKLFDLGEDFYNWNEKNLYLNTLVDRIVSGDPKNSAQELYSLVGKEDELLSVCEPFGLWIIERGKGVESVIKEGDHNVKIILTNDISYYKKRKVRVLNGSHTNLVAMGLFYGCKTVYDCMQNEDLKNFFIDTATNEIIPFVSDCYEETYSFFKEVKDRFLNEYLNHELTSIALNSVSKWRARNLPSFRDYYAKHGKIPENLTLGVSALIALYARAKKQEDGYYSDTPLGKIKLTDGENFLKTLSEGNIDSFLRDESAFGDMSEYEGFIQRVKENVSIFNKEL